MQSNCSGSGHCEGAGSFPSLVQWVKRSGVDTAVAMVTSVVQIQSLPQKLLYVVGVAIKKKKKSDDPQDSGPGSLLTGHQLQVTLPTPLASPDSFSLFCPQGDPILPSAAPPLGLC